MHAAIFVLTGNPDATLGRYFHRTFMTALFGLPRATVQQEP